MLESERAQVILGYWFGRVEETIIPSENRARLWFGENKEIDSEISTEFQQDLEEAIAGKYQEWEKDARGQLALIITFDQFSRHIFRGKAKAYAQDDLALKICLHGMEEEYDHNLSLIERVFYYFPILHSENIVYQESSLKAYEILAELAMPETKIIYESFFKFANHHYSIVRRFGRFPQRNLVLGRKSRPEEIEYLKETDQY